MKLSSRIENLGESITLKLNSKAMKLEESGVEIFNLTAGQLPFRPPQALVDSIKGELDFLKSFQYGPVSGFVDLRQKFLKYIEETRNIQLENSGVEFDCVISNGAKHTFSNVIATLINPGDEVIMISPFWISYPEIIGYFGGKTVKVETSIFDAFTPSISEIQSKITKKTKAIIINSPNNPAGIHYSDEWMSDFAEMIVKYPDVTIISDEIYFELSYFDPKPTYFYQKNPSLLKQTIIVEGISKTLAATGLRIGFCVAPKDFCQGIEKLQGQLTSGANSLVQMAMNNFHFKDSQEYLKPVTEHLRQNSMMLKQQLKDGDLMKCWYQPVSAFYFMLDFSKSPIFKKYRDQSSQTDYSHEICEDLLNQTGVVIVPGSDFGLLNSGRISLVGHREMFEEAMKRIVKFLTQE